MSPASLDAASPDDAAPLADLTVLDFTRVLSGPYGTRLLADLGARVIKIPSVEHPTRGAVRVTASPFHWDGRPVKPTAPAPHRVGEHTRAVLAGVLGYPEARIATLLRAGAVTMP